jgi:hypothetical protein
MSSALVLLQSTDHEPTTTVNEEHDAAISEISVTPRQGSGSSSSNSGRQRPTLSRTSRRVILINRFVRCNNISREQRMKDIVTEMERDRGRMMMISTKRSSSSTVQCNDDDDDNDVDNNKVEDTNDNTTETHGSDENTEHDKPDVTNAITGAGGGGETSTLPTRSQKKKVTWDMVQFRTYETVLGDNPSVSGGAPISLGWRYTNDSELEPSDDDLDDSKLSRSVSAMPIDDYEAIRLPQRMPMEQLVVSQWDREQRLYDAGVSRADMNKVIASVTHIKVSRNQNAKLGFFEKGGFQTLIQKQRKNIGKKKGLLLI